MICNSLFLNRLSCNTFLMATTSFVSTTFASKTTPKLPLPMIRSALYDILSCSVGTPGEFGATACAAEDDVPAVAAAAAEVEDGAAPAPVLLLSFFMVSVSVATPTTAAECDDGGTCAAVDAAAAA